MGVDEWLSSGNNVYAMISITGTLLTAANKEYWKTDEANLRLVANTWAKLIAENGVACCDCSCGNIAMMEWATKYINPDMLAQFKSQVYSATQYQGFAPSPIPNQPSQPSQPGEPSQPNHQGQSEDGSSSGTPEEQQAQAASTPGDEGDQSQSHEITEVSQQSQSENTGMPIAAVVGVVLLVSLIGVGYFKSSIMDFLRR